MEKLSVMVIVVLPDMVSAIVVLSPVHFLNLNPLSGEVCKGTSVFNGNGKESSPGAITLPPSVLLMLRVTSNGGRARAVCSVGTNNRTAVKNKLRTIQIDLERGLLTIDLLFFMAIHLPRETESLDTKPLCVYFSS